MPDGRTRLAVAALVFCLLIPLGLSGQAMAQPAPDGNSVLMLANSVPNRTKSVEAEEAAALGYTVVVASDEQWTAMSAEDFATYRAIVIGDGMCRAGTSLATAEANRDVWGKAVTGRVIVIGTHPGASAEIEPGAQTAPGARALVSGGLQFATSGTGTGAYVTPRCYLAAMPFEVEVLKPFGKFKVARLNACPIEAQVVASDPTLSALDGSLLSGWKCTADAGFLEWPSDFEVFAVATNALPATFVGPADVAGSPFILTRQERAAAPAAAEGSESTLAPADMPNVATSVEGIGLNLSGRHDFAKKDFSTSFAGADVTGSVSAYASWTPNQFDRLEWNADKLRQGETPELKNTLVPSLGNLTLGAGVEIKVGDLPTVSLDVGKEGFCPLWLPGDPGDKTCPIPVDCFTLPACIPVPPIGYPELCLCVSVELQSEVTPSPVTVNRTVLYDETPGTGPGRLTFPPRAQDDWFKVSCYVPEGTAATYQLANPESTPTVGLGIGIGVGGQVCFPPFGCENLFAKTVYDTGEVLDTPFALKGDGGRAPLGPVLADNTPPSLANVGTSYNGVEGSPIQFSAEGAADSCLETISWTWDFSDHGVAFGFEPFHTFEDNAVFSGQLHATDLAGNTAAKDLTVDVTNVAPVAEAGPDMAALWGVPVPFNGAATDPGAGDQTTLVYKWDFGDGSPSATGGPSVTHAYATPGTYTATLKVCDKDGLCHTDTCSTDVRKRNTVIGYLGDQNGVFDTLTMLKASLTDELGAFVQGRSLGFAIGSEAGGAAATNSIGIASKTHVLALGAGGYSVTASFAGDTLYSPAPLSSATYTVAKKPTSVTYTGALFGGPNKTVSLSAVLVDSQGKALANRVIAFQLGAQTASATTNASGVAMTSLKLNQKNGAYPLTATFAPSPADSNFYVGSIASVTFKLQVK